MAKVSNRASCPEAKQTARCPWAALTANAGSKCYAALASQPGAGRQPPLKPGQSCIDFMESYSLFSEKSFPGQVAPVAKYTK
jgi:hypothetical protein